MFTESKVVNAPRTVGYKAYKFAVKNDLLLDSSGVDHPDFYVDYALELRDYLLSTSNFRKH